MTYKELLLLLIDASERQIIKWREYGFRNTSRISELGCELLAYCAVVNGHEVVIQAQAHKGSKETKIAFVVVVYDLVNYKPGQRELSHALSSDKIIINEQEEPKDCDNLIFKLYLVARCMERSGMSGHVYEYPSFGFTGFGYNRYVPYGWSPELFFYKKSDPLEVVEKSVGL